MTDAMNIECVIDNAIEDYSVSGDAMRWTSDEQSEIAYLRRRLAAAEQVATIYGWTAGATQTKKEKAAEQAYADWVNAYGAPRPSPEWRARINKLSRRRDEIVAETLRRIREEKL